MPPSPSSVVRSAAARQRDAVEPTNHNPPLGAQKEGAPPENAELVRPHAVCAYACYPPAWSILMPPLYVSIFNAAPPSPIVPRASFRDIDATFQGTPH